MTRAPMVFSTQFHTADSGAICYSAPMEKTESNQICASECPAHDALPERELKRERRRSRPWTETPVAERLTTNGNETEIKTVDRMPRRWDRLVRLVGVGAVRKLLGSRVTVFGLAGVGSHSVEALARSAIGHLMIVDFDDVCVTNVNRQLQAFPGTVGQSKAHLLAKRVRAINPDANVDPVQAFYEQSNSEALLTPRPDFVIDAIDNVTAKIHLVATCLRQNIPIVSVSGSGARLDPTQVRVDDLSKTHHDPLARVMRKELSRLGFVTSALVGLPVVFSEEAIRHPEVPAWDDEGFRCICPHAEDSPHGCEKRRIIYGTASFVTAAFGMAAASVAVRKLIDGK